MHKNKIWTGPFQKDDGSKAWYYTEGYSGGERFGQVIQTAPPKGEYTAMKSGMLGWMYPIGDKPEHKTFAKAKAAVVKACSEKEKSFWAE